MRLTEHASTFHSIVDPTEALNKFVNERVCMFLIWHFIWVSEQLGMKMYGRNCAFMVSFSSAISLARKPLQPLHRFLYRKMISRPASEAPRLLITNTRL